jgi:ABC-type nitrate/sulfonate/bicarbonate transport system substrate-binding protein
MWDRTRRELLNFAGLALLPGTLATSSAARAASPPSSGAGSAAVETISFAYQPGFAYGLYYVAQTKGWFKDAAVSLHPMDIFTNGPLEMDAVINGNLEAGVLGFVPILTRAAAGQPVRIIDVVDNSGRTYAVVGKATINGIPGLKGKTVGVNRGSNYDYFLLKALAKYGLSERDLKIINFADPAKSQSAFLAGQVDAIVPITTNRDAILQHRPDSKVVFSATQFTEEPNPSRSSFAIYDLFATTASALHQHRNAFVQIMTVFHTKVRDYVTSPRTQSAAVDDLYDWQKNVVKAEVTKEQILANLSRFDFYTKQEAEQIIAGGELKSFLGEISEYLIANKLLDKTPDITSLIDPGPAKAMG